MSEKGHYPLNREGAVPASVNFPSLEKEVLAYWAEDGTFQASIDNREAGDNGSNEFIFYDGPPFANGLPHYGHLLTGYVKDTVGRFQTMQGRRVERRFGWDTHGLPAELEAQKVLGIDDISEITRDDGIGIEKFNEVCRSSVLRYTNEWEEYVTRQARWVDFDNDYKTLDTDYMESVMWAFKTLYDKGLIYKGHRVLPYCWHDRTPLSNHELKMDDEVYQDRQDNTVTVGMRLEKPLLEGASRPELVLIWTTTPWTLPSNLAVAVGPDVDYVLVHVADECQSPVAGENVLIGEARLAAYVKELGEEPEIVARFKGSDLVGLRYHPIFDYFDNVEARAEGADPGPRAWQIIPADYVTTDDGTGLVHIAPAFGEDDMIVSQEAKIGTVVPLDEGGCFTHEITDYAGMQIFDANKPIIVDLRDGTGPMARRPESIRAVLVQQKSYMHSYPHCWRCRKPLIYKAVSSWFVKVTAIRDRMVELNQQITWTPEHIKDGIFGNWLAGARDWSISRNRYWGAPIPVWMSDDPEYPRVDVYGSFAELEKDFGVEVKELHRPFIDSLTRPNPDDPTGRSTMRRVTDVLDCWFESGSMPFAQVHYPFENRQWFEDHYPGDFIVEYVGQTRGWFYTLHVLATALFDRPAFLTCISHGIVLGDDGRKMSKSLRNYPDVNEVFDRYGSDAMRWFLMSSPIVRGGNLVVTEEAIRDTVRQVLLPLWNAYYFFTLYTGAANDCAGYRASFINMGDSDELAMLDVQDRYVLANTKILAQEVREKLESFDISSACSSIRHFIDMLTNWYIRTSRDRFWNEDSRAFDTMYTVLVNLAQIAAPLLPLVSEEIYRGLTGERSVHLTDWPVLPDAAADPELVAQMDEVRDIVSAGHSLRKANQLRVRLPLRTLSIVSDQELTPFLELIASEINVKNVNLETVESCGMTVTRELAVLPRELEPEQRKLTSALFKAAREGAWEEVSNGILMHVEPPVTLKEGQFTLSTVVAAEEGTVATVLPSGAYIALDTQIDDELEAEGYARDAIRAIQDARKAANLHISDRIKLTLTVPEERLEAVRAHEALIASETLAVEVETHAGGTELAIEVEKIHR